MSYRMVLMGNTVKLEPIVKGEIELPYNVAIVLQRLARNHMIDAIILSMQCDITLSTATAMLETLRDAQTL
jgi:hypothetical protein